MISAIFATGFSISAIFAISVVLICDIYEICNSCNSERNFAIFAIACIFGHKCLGQHNYVFSLIGLIMGRLSYRCALDVLTRTAFLQCAG